MVSGTRSFLGGTRWPVVTGPFSGVPPSPVTGPVQSPAPGPAGWRGYPCPGQGQDRGTPGQDRGTPPPPKQDRVPPPDRIGVLPPESIGVSPPDSIGVLTPPPTPRQGSECLRYAVGRYASCGLTGRLSCFFLIFTNHRRSTTEDNVFHVP